MLLRTNRNDTHSFVSMQDEIAASANEWPTSRSRRATAITYAMERKAPVAIKYTAMYRGPTDSNAPPAPTPLAARFPPVEPRGAGVLDPPYLKWLTVPTLGQEGRRDSAFH